MGSGGTQRGCQALTVQKVLGQRCRPVLPSLHGNERTWPPPSALHRALLSLSLSLSDARECEGARGGDCGSTAQALPPSASTPDRPVLAGGAQARHPTCISVSEPPHSDGRLQAPLASHKDHKDLEALPAFPHLFKIETPVIRSHRVSSHPAISVSRCGSGTTGSTEPRGR